MSELVIVAIILLAISILIWVVVRVYNQRMAAVATTHRWTIRERTVYVRGTNSLDAGVRVMLCKGSETIYIGVVPCSAPDFEEQLIELRVQAEDKAAILNRGLNP